MIGISSFLFLSVMALLPTTAWTSDSYDTQFNGEGTVYGEVPTGSGNCAIRSPLPDMYSGMIPVALNR